MIKFNYLFCILALCFCSITASAQFDLVLTLQVAPPYPTKITDYSDNPNKIIATIRNVSTGPKYFWLVGEIKGDNGVTLSSSKNIRPSQSSLINSNEVKFVLFNDMKNMLNLDYVEYSGITKNDIIYYGIPEGNYEVCIRALDYDTGLPLSDVEGGCFPINISYTEPPMIMNPVCDEAIQRTVPQNIVFSWTLPAGANPLTQYTLRIADVNPINRDINDALNTSTTPSFFEQSGIVGSVFLYGPAQPQLINGHKYAFTVKATDPMGNLSFKNDGVSEACSFMYLDSLKDTVQTNVSLVNPLIIPELPSVLPSYTKFIRNNFSYKDSTLAALDRTYKYVKSTSDKYSIAEVSFYIGRKFLMNNKMEQAKQYFIESADTLRNINSIRNRWIPLCNLAYCYKSTGNLLGCKLALNEAVNIIETNPLVSDVDEKSPYYSEMLYSQNLMYNIMIDQMVKFNVIDSALYYAERSNNYGKSRTRGVEPLDYQDANSQKFFDQEKKLYGQVDSLYSLLIKESSTSSTTQQKINSLKQVYTVTESNYLNYIDSIVDAKPELSINFSSNINPKDLFRDKLLIPKNTVVAEYIVSDSAVYVFLVRSDTVICKSIPASKTTIELAVDKYVQLLSRNTKLDYVTKLSSELYNYLIYPIEGYIKQGENIAIVPTGKLLKLPFESLVKIGKDKKSNTYLIEKNPIFYITSLRLFYNPNPNVTNNYKIIAFGNPDNSLPFAEDEVNELKTINPSSEVYVKDEATETRAKNISTGFDVMHFATHGVLDYAKFQNSYILLAPDKDKKNDGKLTMSEVLGITNLRNFNLVTLSACNTAVTDQKIKGWINNPAQSFIDIGVKSVIATLWSVDDKATSMVMKEFYTNLKTMNKVDALRAAQIKLIKSGAFQHPYFWSPFVLIGDYR